MRLEQSSQEGEMVSGEKAVTVEPFRQTLSRHGLKLERGQTTTLQINLSTLQSERRTWAQRKYGLGDR
jgi:hypothetical protein